MYTNTKEFRKTMRFIFNIQIKRHEQNKKFLVKVKRYKILILLRIFEIRNIYVFWEYQMNYKTCIAYSVLKNKHYIHIL